jgi:hypothetical protein
MQWNAGWNECFLLLLLQLTGNMVVIKTGRVVGTVVSIPPIQNTRFALQHSKTVKQYGSLSETSFTRHLYPISPAQHVIMSPLAVVGRTALNRGAKRQLVGKDYELRHVVLG